MSIIDTGTSVAAAKRMPAAPPSDDVEMTMMTRGDNPNVFGDYNSIDMMESESSAIAKMEMWIAKNVGTRLVGTYPGRQWAVQANVQGGIVIISCPSLDPEKGYHILLKDKNIDGICKAAVRAAGEILERFGISRNKKYDSDELEYLARDHKDRVVSTDAMSRETL